MDSTWSCGERLPPGSAGRQSASSAVKVTALFVCNGVERDWSGIKSTIGKYVRWDTQLGRSEHCCVVGVSGLQGFQLWIGPDRFGQMLILLFRQAEVTDLLWKPTKSVFLTLFSAEMAGYICNKQFSGVD